MDVKKQLKEYNERYPLEKRNINGEEFPYRYYRNGDITIVLLTGGIGKADMFYRQFETYAEYYSVIAFDFPEGYHNNEQLAAGIAGLLDELDVNNVYLVGQSYGGMIAQIVAKKYPKRIKGLILSNTAALDKRRSKESKDCIKDMIKSLEKTVNLLKFLSLDILKPIMKKNILRKLAGQEEEEQKYLNDITEIMIGTLDAKHEKHMCKLMVDLRTQWNMKPEDFSMYKGKVLLLLSKEDDTFNDDVKQALIEMMPDPVVRTDLTGGHLALITKSKENFSFIRNFIEKRNA